MKTIEVHIEFYSWKLFIKFIIKNSNRSYGTRTYLQLADSKYSFAPLHKSLVLKYYPHYGKPLFEYNIKYKEYEVAKSSRLYKYFKKI